MRALSVLTLCLFCTSASVALKCFHSFGEHSLTATCTDAFCYKNELVTIDQIIVKRGCLRTIDEKLSLERCVHVRKVIPGSDAQRKETQCVCETDLCNSSALPVPFYYILTHVCLKLLL